MNHYHSLFQAARHPDLSQREVIKEEEKLESKARMAWHGPASMAAMAAMVMVRICGKDVTVTVREISEHFDVETRLRCSRINLFGFGWS